jgi:hypothetical protein
MSADYHKRNRVNIFDEMEPTSLTFDNDVDAFNWASRERVRLEKTFHIHKAGAAAENGELDNWSRATATRAKHYSGTVTDCSAALSGAEEAKDYYVDRDTMARTDPNQRYAALKKNCTK